MQHHLPEAYFRLSETEATARIREHRRRLGDDLVILAHHYQSDPVVAVADRVGDSFELSRFAAATPARRILFAGVHFMAESADILARADQTVVLPNLDAGCPMADLAPIDEVEAAWRQLSDALPADERIMPVTYINSHAAVKAFCGRHGGIICTSSSASQALDWAFARRPIVFFFPDQHLGGNTALDRGIDPAAIVRWDPALPMGGLDRAAVASAKVILWLGHCHVHTRFTPEMVAACRREHPGVRVLVHSECPREVVALAEAHGSTRLIVDRVTSAPPGSVLAIGTEVNLVRRLAARHPDRMVIPLAPSPCPNMHRNTVQDLVYALDRWGEVNVVRVPPAVKADSRVALDRMLSLAAAPQNPAVGMTG